LAACVRSRRQDSNLRSLVPETSAFARLSYAQMCNGARRGERFSDGPERRVRCGVMAARAGFETEGRMPACWHARGARRSRATSGNAVNGRAPSLTWLPCNVHAWCAWSGRQDLHLLPSVPGTDARLIELHPNEIVVSMLSLLHGRESNPRCHRKQRRAFPTQPPCNENEMLGLGGKI
jgi:hypothetical protein